MKNICKIVTTRFMMVVALAGTCMACSSDFLDEKIMTPDNTATFETQDGIDRLAIGIYQNLEFHFWYEYGYTLWNYGTDEMAVGNDGAQEKYNSYTSALDPSGNQGMTDLWNMMYSGISSANTLIKNIPLYYDQKNVNYNTRLGEGYFMRGFNYFKLVQQFGEIPLLLEPAASKTDYTKNSVEEVYAQIISDLKQAYELLPEKAERTGSLTKAAAAHFVAKACLFRASEQYKEWYPNYNNTQDLADVIQYATYVTTTNPLCEDYVALWDYQKPNGANERVSEIVLAAQFSNDATTEGRYGNRQHTYYPSIYQTVAGLKRDISGDREFSRLRPTNYALDVFDRVNDSRFWKSYITTYCCNNPGGAPTWGDYAPAGKSADDKRFAGGEIAIKYIVNDAGDDRYTPENIKYMAPHMYIRYFANEPQDMLGAHGNYGSYSTKDKYVALSKYRDGSREKIADEAGHRDGILARSAEDYLMIAEAYGRQGKYADALPFINALRRRAGYFEGEDRSKHIDGGQAYKNNTAITIPGDGGFGSGFAVYCETNTYYESNNMEGQETTVSTKDAMELKSVNDIWNSTKEFYTELGATSEADKFLVFILNERTRELMGENHRWPDLARTKQLEKRWRLFNDGSLITAQSFDPKKHYLRPLPQNFLDAITKDGKSLTNEEKQAMQNPGY